MKKVVLSFLSLTVFIACHAQTIESQKVGGGYKFSQDGIPLRMQDLVATLESDQVSFELIKKAKSGNSFASVLGFAGGFMLGWTLGSAVGAGEPNWTLAGIGAGLIAIAVPVGAGAGKKSKAAVDLYNASLNSTSYHKFNPRFNLAYGGTHLSLCMSF